MSAYLMGRVFYLDIPAHLKLTLLALADHADDDGSGVKVGQARLADKCSASERAVRGHIADLRALGLIEKLGRVGSRGQDRHRIVVEKLPTDEQIRLPRPAARCRPADVADRQLSAPRPATGRHLDRQPVAAEPSVEPSEEPSVTTSGGISFEDAWRAYPAEGRRAKPTARARWNTATKKAEPAVILAGIWAYANDPNRDPGHTKWMQGWLSEERWNDPPLPSRIGQPRRPRDAAYAQALRDLGGAS